MALHSAVARQDVEVVENLLTNSSLDVDEPDCLGRTPLSYAAETGNIVICQLISKRKVSPDSLSYFQRTPLSYASEHGHKAVVKLLLDIGAEPDQSPYGHEWRTPPHTVRDSSRSDSRSISRGSRSRRPSQASSDSSGSSSDSRYISRRSRFRRLRFRRSALASPGSSRYSPDSRNNSPKSDSLCYSIPYPLPPSRRTPLSYAASNGHEAIVDLLLERGAEPFRECDIDEENDRKWTPLTYALHNGHEGVVKLLLARHGRANLSMAAAAGDVFLTDYLISNGDTNLDNCEMGGLTPLSHAASLGHEEVVHLLLAKGAEPDWKGNANQNNDLGRTPLSYAASNGREKVVELLLKQQSVDVNSQNTDGRTPLTWAVKYGHEDIVKLLLSTDNIDPNLQDKYGRTPLSWAVKNGHEDIVKLLLSIDSVDPNLQDKDGRTPIFYTENHRVDIIDLLLSADSVDPNFQDNEGRTPMSLAAEYNRELVISSLLETSGLKPNLPDKYGRTPLSWAAEKGHLLTVELLLRNDVVEPNMSDHSSKTPLWWASENKHRDVMRCLMNLDRVTLHHLVRKEQRLLILSLLKVGYNVDVKDSRGRTPLHFAVLDGRSEIATDLIPRADINAEDIYGMSPLRLAIKYRKYDFIDLLLENSAEIEGLMAQEWRHAYGRQPSDVINLSERQGSWHLKFITKEEYLEEFASSLVGVELKGRNLFIFGDYTVWKRGLSRDMSDIAQPDRLEILQQEWDDGGQISFSACIWFPAGETSDKRDVFQIPDGGKCAITWTMMSPHSSSKGLWNLKNCYSMLPYGWIPDDGAGFFKQLLLHLKGRWTDLCLKADKHLSKRRLDQLFAKGQNPNLINLLAEDALIWAKFRSNLQLQVDNAKDFARLSVPYSDEVHLKDLQDFIESFSQDINKSIDDLDQTIRDLLQLEFAWVSTNEAHTSTSISKSMKRLNWITFIFLPLTFASSFFGMNVNIVKDNPDWRWFVIFGGSALTLTMMTWLVFKYFNIEKWFESLDRQIRGVVQNWSKSSQINVEEGDIEGS